MKTLKNCFFLVAMTAVLQACSVRSDSSAEKQKHYVIVMSGQSNMVGQGKVDDIGAIEVPANVKYFNANRPPSFDPDPKRFGPEVGVMKILGEEFPDTNFIIIKYANGGSSLLDWAPDYDIERAKITGHPEKGNLFKKLTDNVDSITANYDTEFLAFMWMQGERDARVPEAGREYYENFKTFIDAVRAKTSSDIPFLFGLVNPDPDKYPALETVQAAQKKVAMEQDNLYLIDTATLEKWKDKVHYSTKGVLALGDRFGRQLVEIMKRDKGHSRPAENPM